MSQASTDELGLISLQKPASKFLLILPILFALVISWFAVRWYIGDTLAEYAPRMADGGLGIAQSAVELAPSDPLTHWSVASLRKKSLSPSEIQASIKGFETAVSLSPNDYRLWVDLGRALSESGDLPGAEKAFRQGVALAPAYGFPRWYLGNLLLREGKIDDAFAELRRAADANPDLRPQIFNLATHVYGDDVETIKSVLGGSGEAKRQLVGYLISRNRVDEAVRVWSSLSSEEQGSDRQSGMLLQNALVKEKKYHPALDVFRSMNPADGDGAQVGSVLNPSFESAVSDNGQNLFGWQAKNSPPQVQLGVDRGVHHGGDRSLRVVFKSNSQLNFDNLMQLVATEPSTSYRLEFYARSEELKSIGRPFIEVVDSVDGNQLGKSEQVNFGSNDWRLFTIDFKTGARTDAVTIRSNRESCGAETEVCPIFGVVWYDDFNLQRAGGSTASASNTEQPRQQPRKN